MGRARFLAVTARVNWCRPLGAAHGLQEEQRLKPLTAPGKRFTNPERRKGKTKTAFKKKQKQPKRHQSLDTTHSSARTCPRFQSGNMSPQSIIVENWGVLIVFGVPDWFRQLSATFRRVPEPFGQFAEKVRQLTEKMRFEPEWIGDLPEEFGHEPESFRQFTDGFRRLILVLGGTIAAGVRP